MKNSIKWNRKFCKWFDLPQAKTKFVYFSNPSDCKQFDYERINPTHIGVLWGRRKRSNNWVRVARVNIASVWVGFFDKIQMGLEYVFNNIDMVSLCFYICFALFIYAVVLNINVLEGFLCLRRMG